MHSLPLIVVAVALRSMTCLSTMVHVLFTRARSCLNEKALSVVWSLQPVYTTGHSGRDCFSSIQIDLFSSFILQRPSPLQSTKKLKPTIIVFIKVEIVDGVK